jgi:hypothetical protein
LQLLFVYPIIKAMNAPKKGRGRPKKPAKDRATAQVHFRCTAAEKASYRRKAKPKGISAWLKDLADKQ